MLFVKTAGLSKLNKAWTEYTTQVNAEIFHFMNQDYC